MASDAGKVSPLHQFPPLQSDRQTVKFPISEPPPHGAFLSPAPGILWARLPIPFALDHVNVYLIEDGDGWAVIEAGANTEAARGVWLRLLDALPEPRRITRIIVTHSHPDHVGAAGYLCDLTGAPLVMTRREYDMANEMLANAEADRDTYRRFFQRHGLSDVTTDIVLSLSYDYRIGMGRLPARCDHIADGDTLRIGGRDYAVITGSGHSPQLAMLHDAERGILLCADQVLSRISPNVSVLAMQPEADPLGQYLASLARLKRKAPADVLVLPGHELPFHGLHERIDELMAHHEDRCRAIETACAGEALTASDLVPHVFGREFRESQLGFAVTETLAHVNLLRGRRRLVEESVGNGLAYRRMAG
jgi:glyoxylase-like metal-dependent hydrolase (beta-lactamase superfamily II)